MHHPCVIMCNDGEGVCYFEVQSWIDFAFLFVYLLQNWCEVIAAVFLASESKNVYCPILRADNEEQTLSGSYKVATV